MFQVKYVEGKKHIVYILISGPVKILLKRKPYRVALSVVS